MKTKHLTGQPAGFTLIETLMAMAIFTVGILGLFGMQSAAIKENLSAGTITTGAAWASYQVEQLLGMDYNLLQDTDKDGCDGLDHRTDTTAEGNFTSDTHMPPVYKVYWNVANNCTLIGIPNAANPKDEEKPKFLRVIVTKQNSSGQEVQAAVFNYIKQNSRD